MFHVVTVHWQSTDWIEPQLRYLHQFMPDDTRVYASLNGIDVDAIAPADRARFSYIEDLPGTHPQKLNALATVVSSDAKPDDYLVFLDGDAFPIAPITPDVLHGRPLAAVRRDENEGDPQPHPCFCVTTVGFWNDIGGDWRPGYTWTNSLGYRTSDVGGNLLGILRERDLAWHPLIRTNAVNLHPLWFGIYGDVVYHHGAGFRGRIARATLGVRRAIAPSWMPVLRRIDKERAINGAMRRRAADPSIAAQENAQAQAVLDSIRTDGAVLRELTGTA
jgi:hypothetical protein